VFTFEIDILTKRNSTQLKTHPGFRAIQAIRGVGPVLAAIFVAEIGDVTRFARPEQLCSWAGMTPKHRESDTKVHRGRKTKQGNPLVRWAAVEAVQTLRAGPLGRARVRIGERLGANIGKVAAAQDSSRWCCTGCAMVISVAWPLRREDQVRRSQARGRSVSDPRRGAVDPS
jgi:transposase